MQIFGHNSFPAIERISFRDMVAAWRIALILLDFCNTSLIFSDFLLRQPEVRLRAESPSCDSLGWSAKREAPGEDRPTNPLRPVRAGRRAGMVRRLCSGLSGL